jgi:hypothetical protein
MDLLGLGGRPDDSPIPGSSYISTLHKYLRANLPRLAPQRPSSPTFLQQTYTLFTLGLDPNSAPLSRLRSRAKDLRRNRFFCASRPIDCFTSCCGGKACRKLYHMSEARTSRCQRG